MNKEEKNLLKYLESQPHAKREFRLKELQQAAADAGYDNGPGHLEGVAFVDGARHMFDQLQAELAELRKDENCAWKVKCLEMQEQLQDREDENQRLREALEFYANPMNYSIDHDTSQMGTSRRVILYSDQEERNEYTIIAGKRARQALQKESGGSGGENE